MAFDIQDFAAACETAMAGADDRQEAARALLAQLLADNTPDEIIAVLDAAVPEGADIGELIVYGSETLTLLYARVPPRFESGIHNHLMFACIGQLTGREDNTLYERDGDGGLRVASENTVNPGEVFTLPTDVVHHIANPTDEVASALHLYGGDLAGRAPDRSLWTTEGHDEIQFSFPALLRESVVAMKKSDNTAGLDAVVAAMPAAKPLIDSL